MHVGDICNLGIACVYPTSNRNLLDFITETLDPGGCAHIAYADDNTVKSFVPQINRLVRASGSRNIVRLA
jgi:hypothetical protein